MKQVSQDMMWGMKVLLKHYKEKTSLSYCPLCNARTKILDCGECPWILFGYKSANTNNSFACEAWLSKQQYINPYFGFSIVRKHPDQFDDIRKKRINMLTQWIRHSEVV